jgi:protein-S-isoprenylcysteine O-methyltransferase Ste14
MNKKFIQHTQREYSPGRRIAALIVEGIFFILLIPLALYYASGWLDARFGLPSLNFGTANLIIGGLLIVAGFLFAIWAVYVQFTLGRGTPVPVMATQKLIIEKPYNYCRNPMALGTIVLYLGFAILIGSISALVLVVILSALLLYYIKTVEEKEMEMRFGESYETYRQSTPFILPRLK